MQGIESQEELRADPANLDKWHAALGFRPLLNMDLESASRKEGRGEYHILPMTERVPQAAEERTGSDLLGSLALHA